MNSFLTITCLLALTASSRAGGLGGLDGLGGLVYAPGHASADYYSYPKYAFEYAVKDPHTGDNKAQWEKRDGDVVKGAYSLVEPDGSLRVVEYWADDKSGFNAVVKRIGPNLHPTVVPAAPIYKAPIPVLESHGPIAPINIGSVAKYSGLAQAPLITGPYLGGGAVSSANLYKESSPVLLKAPIIPEPIYKAPIIAEQVYKAPIIQEQIYKAPLAPLPIYKAPAPLLNYGPIVKSAPILSAPYSGPILSSLGGYGGYNGLKGGYGGLKGGYDGLLKGGYLEELGSGLINKGPQLPSYGYSDLRYLGGLGYDLGYKH